MKSLYRIALVQNTSEMMRFGWADIRPTLSQFEYSVDAYTDETIERLVHPLQIGAYDALILATNSCNSARILTCLQEQKDAIAAHLTRGGGIFLSYQAKLGQHDRFGFLPDHLDLRATTRDRAAEKTTDAGLSLGSDAQAHPLCCYPQRLDLGDIAARCRRNTLVAGVYWAYLSAIVPESYETVLLDDAVRPARSLILASRADMAGRVVASTLVIDWQGHASLFENVVRYVTEGRPVVALISRNGTESKSFRYLTMSLGIKKVPFAHYTVSTLEDVQHIPRHLHQCAVFAPSWSPNEIATAHSHQPFVGSGAFSQALYFQQLGGRDVSLSILSRRSEFQRISRNAIAWLLASYDEQVSPYWGGSFWTTTDVLQTLADFDQPIDQYVEPLLREIDKHDIDGSYDEVLGTTAALLELYRVLLGKKHDRYRRTRDWVKAHIEGKDLHERATAVGALKRAGEVVSAKLVERVKDDILAVRGDLRNEFALQRFIRVLVTCGFADEAKPLARTLKDLQDKASGTWVNVANTAATVVTLLELQKLTRKPEEWIDEMIFLGVLACRSAYGEAAHSWNGDVLATATCLRALAAFEEHIEFAVDEAIWSLEGVRREAHGIVAIESASRINVRLQRANNELATKARALTRKSRAAKWLAAGSASVLALVALTLGGFALYVSGDDKKTVVVDVIKGFVASRSLWFLSAASLVPVGVLVVILAYLGVLPRWATVALEWMGLSKPETPETSADTPSEGNRGS